MVFKNIFVYPKYPENLQLLYLLSQNLWCTWNYEAIKLFYRIDPELFRRVNHNPVEFLLKLPKETMEGLSQDKGFVFELERVWQKFQDYMAKVPAERGPNNIKGSEPGKGPGVPGLSQSDVVAYFAMEFGLHECIPIYGGGLGILSGDFLKAASDLSLPIIAVGLIYKFGYFTQRINLHGHQEELFIEFQNHLIPMREVLGPNGEKAYVKIPILQQQLKIKLWQIDVGKIKLILLDTDIEDNPADLRNITAELYVADREKRLQQELVLGFGGVKALEYLNIEPKIYHINEGHSAFLIIARLRRLMTEMKLSFSQAKSLIRSSTVFTTHTPVKAGNESFKTDLVKKYLEDELEGLGLSFDELAAHASVKNEQSDFCLSVLAIRFAKYVNAVSKIHHDVSRRMWAELFPSYPVVEVPIDYVTNGVHRSWLSEASTDLLSRYIGPDYVHCGENEQIWEKIMDIGDEEIWDMHRKNKQNMVAFIRKKLRDDMAARGYIESKISRLARLFNPEYLTVVFARRFAQYKRATLILKDKDRLRKILADSRKPVQLIFAGKAHPADSIGKDMIKEIIDFAKDYKLEDRVLFLENYDINVARHLVWGADLWLNTPVKENEASGTSGMKAAINGVLNLSVLDGWWPEGYNGRNGWAITAGEFYARSSLQEQAEAEQIYDLLEEEITELFYERNELGIPEKWVRMMKESIYSVCRKFNMNRVLLAYLQKLYLPAKLRFERLSGEDFRLLKEATGPGSAEASLLAHWDDVKFVQFSINVDAKDRLAEADSVQIQCAVDLAKTSAELFSVELLYMIDGGNRFKIIPMQQQSQKGTLTYYGCSLNIEGYGLQSLNARIKPSNEVLQDLYPELIKWAQ